MHSKIIYLFVEFLFFLYSWVFFLFFIVEQICSILWFGLIIPYILIYNMTIFEMRNSFCEFFIHQMAAILNFFFNKNLYSWQNIFQYIFLQLCLKFPTFWDTTWPYLKWEIHFAIFLFTKWRPFWNYGVSEKCSRVPVWHRLDSDSE